VERHLAFLGEKGGDVERLLRRGIASDAAAAEAFAPWYAEPWRDRTNRFMAVDAQTWLPDESLIRSDRLTMAHGLEQRVPFLDAELADLAYRIPSRLKLDRRDLGKRVLREAFADLLPPEIANQPKRGFFSPAAKWLRGDLLPVAREVLSDSYVQGTETFIDLAQARALLDGHVAKRGYHLNAVWAAMTFQAWWKASV
jgi:asparagine synthase (glutamine-hydrolysing)